MGDLRLRSSYFVCVACREGDYAADHWLGVLGMLTFAARELVCLAGLGAGFATATERLKKFCGWTVSPQTMRRTCEAEGRRIEHWREGHGETSRNPNPSTNLEAIAASVAEPLPTEPLPTEPLPTEPLPTEPLPTEPLPAAVEPSSTVMKPVTPGDEANAAPQPLAPTPSASLAAAAQPIPAQQTPVQQVQQVPAQHASQHAPAQPATAASAAFRAAAGESEFLTDGTSVNTTDGWRELRIALWLKRLLAKPAETHQWSDRFVPKPTARSVLIDLADAESFAARWRPWANALGITDPRDLSILADGAAWIWNHAEQQFPGATGVLDIYHALEHLADAAKAIFGAGGTAVGWSDVGARWLLRDGWLGICHWVAAVRENQDNAPAAVVATEELLKYFAKHTTRLGYAQRLAQGKSIGSGPVEGAAKQLVGRRLKQTGARWRADNAIAMATLCSCDYAADWDAYWQQSYLNLAV